MKHHPIETGIIACCIAVALAAIVLRPSEFVDGFRVATSRGGLFLIACAMLALAGYGLGVLVARARRQAID